MSVSLLVALALQTPVLAQEEYRLTSDQVIVSEAGDSVTVFVSVLDASGKPVGGVTEFAAAVDGTPVKVEAVESVSDSEAEVAVLIMLDTSGSMAGLALAQAKAAAEALVEQLSSGDVAAVLPFAGQVPDRVDFTSSRDGLLAAIRRAQAEQDPGTALYDAVAEGLGTFSEATVPRRAIVLLTDGQNTGGLSKNSREGILLTAAAAGVPVFTVGLGEEADNDFLSRLAESSGGSWYFAPSSSDVVAIFDEIGAKLRGQYAVTAFLPPSGNTERDIVVSVEIGGTALSTRARFSGTAQQGKLAGEGNGSSLWPWTVAATGGALVLIASVVSIRWRRRARQVISGGPGQNVAVPFQTGDSTQQSSPPVGRLRVTEGPNAGASVMVATTPVEIGTDRDCSLRLDPVGGAVAAKHARVWSQGGSFILHHLARGRETLVGEKQVEWARLETGDTFRIGPHSIVFSTVVRPDQEGTDLPSTTR